MVTVKLLTDKGHVKASTGCSPNGYYFIPAYDHGNYTVKVEGPAGWSFAPPQAQVTIGDDGQCNAGKDVDFTFTGFTLSGKVVDASGNGPAGVTLHLKATDSSSFTAEAVSVQGGAYSFKNLFPGAYVITASHLTWSFATREVKVNMPADKYDLPTDIVVSGYDVSGRVVSGNDPIPDVTFLLYSETVKGAKCKKASGSHKSGKLSPLCQGTSNSDGVFSISGLPNGQYHVVPYYKTAKTAYEVAPGRMDFTIDSGSYAFDSDFKVTGFSVSGKVVDVKGKGIAGAKITVDNAEKAVTDASGNYRLEGISSGKYTIAASKDHMFFEPLMDHMISSRAPELPSIVVSKLHLCGKLTLNDGQAAQRQLLLTDSSGDQQRTTADAKGNYCFQVVPGPYTVMAVLSSEERAAGLLLSPPQHAITLTTEPRLDADFQQSLVRIAGKVDCLDSCDKDIEVTLVTLGASRKPVTVRLGDSKQANKFEFSNVSPGKYQVTIHHESYCWKDTSREITVSTQNVEDIDFKQQGYVLEATVPHEMQVEIKLTGSKSKPRQDTFTPGTNRICLDKKGVYSLAQKSCYRFKDEVTRYDTQNPTPIEYKVDQYLVTGTITAVHDSKKDVDITVNLRVLEGSEPEAVIKAERSGSKGDKHTYRYNYWARSGDVLEVVPSSPILLFYPRDTKYTVSTTGADGDGCPAPVPVFEARPGLFIQGSVTPKAAGVEVSVVASETAKVIRSVETNKEGKYEIGPLHDDQEFTLRATKPGFHFEQTDELPKITAGKRRLSCSFRSVKLGSVDVLVTDHSGKPLSDVSLSLSGDEYRSNKKTDSTGTHQFAELFPGQYFLRPQSSEYQFEPPTIEVSASEGKESNVVVKGKRFAYSCFGSVKSLTGQPEKHVSVEAVPVGDSEQEYKESSSDAEGNFRVRGLVPNVKYAVRVKGGVKNNIDRASPASVTVSVKDDDIRDVSFVAFRRIPKFEITGEVTTDSADVLSSITVDVYLAKDKSKNDKKAVRSVTLTPGANFFHFFALPRDDYVVVVSSSLPAVTHVHKTVEMEVSKDADSPVHLAIPFDVHTKKLATEVSGGNATATILGLLGLLAFVYRRSLMVTFKNFNKPSASSGPERRYDDGLNQLNRGGKAGKGKKK
eukprot:TRINITY_DN788_c0_g1_i3.p1 TRINITY_DN788_c0_g1~~TRINITY_DN788_c0_g1_i3.p1  ORF type:complete len:1135 (-),score=420.77 TRINITY_DN788_c0_g1_i3:2349-5753(-)